MYRQSFLQIIWQFVPITSVAIGQTQGCNTRTSGRHSFFPYPTHRQYLPTQGHFSRHGHFRCTRFRQCQTQNRCHHRHTRGRSILGCSTLRNVQMKGMRVEEIVAILVIIIIITLIIIIIILFLRFTIVLLQIRSCHRHGNLRRFLHNVTQLTRHGKGIIILFRFGCHCFNVQGRSTHAGIGQSHNDTQWQRILVVQSITGKNWFPHKIR
mmetsp:Transcript_23549/g.35772  ORF Transcript_23549/g.35772 Transcript_23549/m.35772 type:complete len:210 (-) Transcript_23549:75-704(-)